MHKIILHFDINKTIIIEDKAGNKTIEACCNQILMKTLWGKINETKKNLLERWEWVSEEPTITPPSSNLICYDQFIELFAFPYPTLEKDVPPEEQLRIKKEVKNKRLKIIKNFTEKGFAGEKFRKYYEELLNYLKIPECNAKYFNLIPSFFEAISDLSKMNKKFSIIFRYFFNHFFDD